ncbi:MAG: SDR family oxidoreductase [Paraburkholderia sp.]|uniref:SDR family oxidoreductase n=1 Tax=Paraburkholderia sp. TaxID=1926495 RepID=UPI003C684811
MAETNQRNLMVTGASRGIGAAIAKLAAEQGYDVCITYQTNAKKAEAVVEEIRALGRRAMAVKADAGSEAELVAAFEAMDAEIGPVTHLVNNASSTVRKCQIHEVDAKTLEDTFRINVASYFICAREALKRMSILYGGAGGAIVNISSVAALRANPFDWVHYGASKGAVDTFTIGLGFEGVQHGVRCNAVRPGPIDTDMNTADHFATLIASVPMGRVGQPVEVAAAALFLLSDAASFTTGSILNVSGGRF